VLTTVALTKTGAYQKETNRDIFQKFHALPTLITVSYLTLYYLTLHSLNMFIQSLIPFGPNTLNFHSLVSHAMCSSASEGKTRVMVSLGISTKLCVTEEFTLSERRGNHTSTSEGNWRIQDCHSCALSQLCFFLLLLRWTCSHPWLQE